MAAAIQDGYNGCAGYSWYVSPRDYIPWQSQSVNNYRSRAPKTRYIPIHLASGQRGEISEILYPQGDYIQYGYNSVTGDRTSVSDSQGHTWHYTYNSMGRVTSATDPRGTATIVGYSANNWDLTTISNGLGRVALSYNSQHNILSFTDFLTNTTTLTYNSFGELTSVVDAQGITNQYFYDASNRPSAIVRAGQTLATTGG
jgi:YD repeat-containing protein